MVVYYSQQSMDRTSPVFRRVQKQAKASTDRTPAAAAAHASAGKAAAVSAPSSHNPPIVAEPTAVPTAKIPRRPHEFMRQMHAQATSTAARPADAPANAQRPPGSAMVAVATTNNAAIRTTSKDKTKHRILRRPVARPGSPVADGSICSGDPPRPRTFSPVPAR